MVRRTSYSEGDLFSIPLDDAHTALVLTARRGPRGISLGYFFGPYSPDLDDVVITELRPDAAVLVSHFGDPLIRDGTWPKVGQMPDWSHDDWSCRFFRRQVEPYGTCFRSEYDDENPEIFMREDVISEEQAAGLPDEGMLGAGIVAGKLRWLLGMRSE